VTNRKDPSPTLDGPLHKKKQGERQKCSSVIITDEDFDFDSMTEKKSKGLNGKDKRKKT
jgi:hypothetical protein